MFSHLFIGISTRTAVLDDTAHAAAGVISPRSASAIMIPSGPAIMSARAAITTIEFSPVAARAAPPLIMFAVAMLFVPTAVTSSNSGYFTSCVTSPRPIFPPCPSTTRTFFKM